MLSTGFKAREIGPQAGHLLRGCWLPGLHPGVQWSVFRAHGVQGLGLGVCTIVSVPDVLNPRSCLAAS